MLNEERGEKPEREPGQTPTAAQAPRPAAKSSSATAPRTALKDAIRPSARRKLRRIGAPARWRAMTAVSRIARVASPRPSTSPTTDVQAICSCRAPIADAPASAPTAICTPICAAMPPIRARPRVAPRRMAETDKPALTASRTVSGRRSSSVARGGRAPGPAASPLAPVRDAWL